MTGILRGDFIAASDSLWSVSSTTWATRKYLKLVSEMDQENIYPVA